MVVPKRNVLSWMLPELQGRNEDQSRDANFWFIHPNTVVRWAFLHIVISVYIFYSFGFWSLFDSSVRKKNYYCGEATPEVAKAYALVDNNVHDFFCFTSFCVYAWYISQPHCKSHDEHAACSRVNAQAEKAMGKMLKNLGAFFKTWRRLLGSFLLISILIAYKIIQMNAFSALYGVKDQQKAFSMSVCSNIAISMTFLFVKTVLLYMTPVDSGWPLMFKVTANCIATCLLWWLANVSGTSTIEVAGGHWFVYCFFFDNVLTYLYFQCFQDTRYANSNFHRIEEGLFEMYLACTKRYGKPNCICRSKGIFLLYAAGRWTHRFLTFLFFLHFWSILSQSAPRNYNFADECRNPVPMIFAPLGFGSIPEPQNKSVFRWLFS